VPRQRNAVRTARRARSQSIIMVNRSLPRTVAICLTFVKAAKAPANRGIFTAAESQQTARYRPFAQILGKLYFVQFFENLRRILVDYGQKHRRRANAAFNAAC
jgi:hypothetical protein